jgi:hypothetical protein
MKDFPGIRWVILLGATGFAAGFFGPLIFVPEANQGPLVGIFISGPIGAVLGLALYTACSLFKVSARNQWRLLLGTVIVGVVTTLLYVQPSPALQGTIFDAEITACSSPIDVEAETLKYWQQRVVEVTWTSPRSDWQRDMHRALQDAPGVIVTMQLGRENSVFENRKPWNRGTLFASGWKDISEKKSFYRPKDSCDEFPLGHQLQGFQHYNLGGKIEPAKDWPPIEIENFINASTFAAVPERFKVFQ